MRILRAFLSKNRLIIWLIGGAVFIFGLISLAKHDHFQTFAWDLAFFDELLWKTSRGIPPFSSLVNLHLLGDHFQPVILLLTPLYWISSDVQALLIAHSVIAVLSVLPFYLIAKRKLQSTSLALAIALSFLLFTGYRFAVLDGFHQSVFAPFTLGWLYYFLERQNNLGYSIATVGLLLVKEEYALLLSAIGLVIVFYYRRKALGIATVAIGLVSFFLIIYFIIPYFQNGPYTHFGYGELGQTPPAVLYNSLTNPQRLVGLLFHQRLNSEL